MFLTWSIMFLLRHVLNGWRVLATETINHKPKHEMKMCVFLFKTCFVVPFKTLLVWLKLQKPKCWSTIS